jgi:PemK-like, MazF-like toxin of type II toxin-antitoxin system
VLVSYAPNPDGRPDPGEVVWTTVSFEDDPSQSKDRPVLIIGRRGAWLAGLLLTSKSPGAGPTRVYMDVGRGPWDRQQRPSQVRLDRLLDIDPAGVRREGAALDRALFVKVLEAARPYLPELR